MVELTTRIRGVLRDLSVVSETPAIRYDGDRVSSGASKSAPPPNVRFGRRDLRDLSLAEYWGDRFRKCKGDTDKLTFFLFLAEKDLREAKRRPTPIDPHETPTARAERVLEQYEGLSALEAAVAEGTTELWIRATRLNNERDPETGWPKP